MGKIVVLVCGLLLTCVNTFAVQIQSPEALRSEVAKANEMYPGTCQAWSDCLDPYGNPYKRIYCYSSGPYCTWYVQPYEYVVCTGSDMYGNYYRNYQTCN